MSLRCSVPFGEQAEVGHEKRKLRTTSIRTGFRAGVLAQGEIGDTCGKSLSQLSAAFAQNVWSWGWRLVVLPTPPLGQMAWLKGRPNPLGSPGGGVRAVQLCSSFWTGSTPPEFGGGGLEWPQECGWVGWRSGRTWCEAVTPNLERGGWSYEESSQKSKGGAGEGAHASFQKRFALLGVSTGSGSAAFPGYWLAIHQQSGLLFNASTLISSCPSPSRAPPPASPLSFVVKDFFQSKEGFGIDVLGLKFLNSHRLGVRGCFDC